MRYDLQLSRDGFSIEAGYEKGRTDLPPWYLDAPDIDEVFDPVLLKAFYRLSSTRSFGFGAGPIPWDRMVLYAEFLELDKEATRVFTDIIEEMDAAYLAWHAENPRERITADDAKK